jgi:hypothetical protein
LKGYLLLIAVTVVYMLIFFGWREWINKRSFDFLGLGFTLRFFGQQLDACV